MIGTQLRAELSRPLRGDSRWIRWEDGPFVHRAHPEHLSRIRAEKARVAVEQDILNFRRLMTRTNNALRFG